MKMHYDEQVDALHPSVDDSDIAESEEVKPGIILDCANPKEITFAVASGGEKR